MFGWQHPEMCRAEIAIKTSKRQLKKTYTTAKKLRLFLFTIKRVPVYNLQLALEKNPRGAQAPGARGRDVCVCVCVCVCVQCLPAP